MLIFILQLSIHPYKILARRALALNGGDIADGARPYGNVMTPMHLKSNNRYGLKLNSDFGLRT